MSKAERLVEDFKLCRGAFPYKDMVRLLKNAGFEEKPTGNGSKRKFVHTTHKWIVRLHEPHPGNEVKAYMVREVREYLMEQGVI